MITDMDNWTNIRRDVLASGISRREACRKYNLNFRTIQKILSHPEPPGYGQQTVRDKPQIGPFIPIIHKILEADKKVHKKQRHTGKRIFDRLRDEEPNLDTAPRAGCRPLASRMEPDQKPAARIDHRKVPGRVQLDLEPERVAIEGDALLKIADKYCCVST